MIYIVGAFLIVVYLWFDIHSQISFIFNTLYDFKVF